MPAGDRLGLADLSLRDWVEALASARPVPAGGSLAAATGAAAAALAAKIARLATGGGDRRDLSDRLLSLARRLLECSDRDAAVYLAWKSRRDALAAADMVRVPQEIEALCRSAAEACRDAGAGVAAAPAEDVRAAGEILRACERAAAGIAAVNRRTIEAAT